MALKKGGLHFGYHDHYAVDGGKARIILEVLVTPADVMENQPFLDMLWRACFRWRIRPDQVTGDTTYGTVENIVAVEDQQIHAYVPLPDFDQRTPFYGASTVHLRSRARRVPLPTGQPLRRSHAKYTEGVVVYQADSRDLQRLPDEGCLHREQPGAAGAAVLVRRVPRPCARLPRDAAYEKAMAQAEGLGRAAVR